MNKSTTFLHKIIACYREDCRDFKFQPAPCLCNTVSMSCFRFLARLLAQELTRLRQKGQQKICRFYTGIKAVLAALMKTWKYLNDLKADRTLRKFCAHLGNCKDTVPHRDRSRMRISANRIHGVISTSYTEEADEASKLQKQYTGSR